MTRLIFLSIIVVSLSACGGAGSGFTAPQTAHMGPDITGSATMHIDVPAPKTSSLGRQPRYISSATQSIAVTPSGGTRQVFALTPASPNCTAVSNGGSNLSCTLQISAPVAQNESFNVVTYASTDGSGNALSTAMVIGNVVAGQVNVLNATLSGVVASVSVALTTAGTIAGTSASSPVTVAALDAAGETIVGPGNYVDASGNPLTIALSTSDTSKTTLSTTSVTAPGQSVTLTYNGAPTGNLYVSNTAGCACILGYGPSATFETVVISATASGTSGGIATLTITPRTFGNVAPRRVLAIPQFNAGAGNAGIAVDASGNLYVADLNNPPNADSAIYVYPPGATGNQPPIRTIEGSSTGLVRATGIAFDPGGNLYVGNAGTQPSEASVTVYAPGASGNVAPIRTISGSNTNITGARGVALDAAADLAVGNYNGNVCAPNYTLVFAPGANGNVAPARQILPGCPATYGLQFDKNGNLYEAINNSDQIQIYSPSANGSVAPTNTISGSNTQISLPSGIVFDASQYLYVANQGNGASITIYAPGASGNVTPIYTISGSNTLLNTPTFLAVGPPDAT